jgi:flagellar biosynthetic protein FlhB
MAEDLGEKSEAPTARRKQEARRDGNVARSQDLSGAIMLTAGTVLMVVLGVPMIRQFKTVLEAVLSNDALGNPLLVSEAGTVAEYVGVSAARAIGPMLLMLGLAAFVAHFVQVGWLFTLKPLKPTLSKLSPIAGAKRLLGLNSLFKALMSIVKLAIIAAIVMVTIYQYRRDIVVLAYLSPVQCLFKTAVLMLDLALRILAVLILLGLIDFAFQRWKHYQDLKMTKQAVKDEMKQVDGDPQVKQRRYRMQQQIAMQRINAAVPRADVVVTNPEHVSVAIRYDADQMHAPTVVAKGADHLALRIRQLALINRIPLVERPPLARALYRQVEVGHEIPPDFYHAVAEILAYVYQLDGRMAG